MEIANKFKILILTLLICFISITSTYAANRVRLGPEYFPQDAAGRPLAFADIYVGNPDTDPTIAGNQKQLYVLEENGTLTAVTQPITTGAGGVPLYNGDPVTLFVYGVYSVSVLNSSGSQVYYVPSSSTTDIDGTLVLLSDYDDLADAVSSIGSDPTELWIDTDDTMDENVTTPSTLTLKFIPGNIITTTGYLLTIGGPTNDPLFQIFDGDGDEVLFLVGSLVEGIRPEWWGGLGDDSTDCTNAFLEADLCVYTGVEHYSPGTIKQKIALAQGVYRVTATSGNFAVTLQNGMSGMGPMESTIKNVGTGSALRIQLTTWIEFSDFMVLGNDSSEDGIVVGWTVGTLAIYQTFRNVHSMFHGSDGLVINHGWASEFFSCRFNYNGDLGVNLMPDATGSTKNAIHFWNCQASGNGGLTDNWTSNTKGGVRITNANNVYWHGGTVEGNNAKGFIIGTDTANNNIITVDGAYIEYNPPDTIPGVGTVLSTTGANIYADDKYQNVEVKNCYILYGGERAGQTGYGFYIAGTPPVAEGDIYNTYFKEHSNYAVGAGSGTLIRDYGLYMDWTRTYVSNPLAAGTHIFYQVDENSDVSVSGFIHITETGTDDRGIYPFSVGYDTGLGSEVIEIGDSILSQTAGGTSSAIATGGTIAHGLGVAPTRHLVTAAEAGPTDIYHSADATNITVNFGGGGNKTFNWWAQSIIGVSTAPSIAYNATRNDFELTIPSGMVGHIELTFDGKQANADNNYSLPTYDTTHGGQTWNNDFCKRAN